jgi:galactonate dehydratase
MHRREFVKNTSAAWAVAGIFTGQEATGAATVQRPNPPGPIKITGVKAIPVSPPPPTDRPYVFVKIETDAGITGLGEVTLEGKAGSVLACVSDMKDFLIGQDPTRVEHLWQSMYIHSFYRGGPVIVSTISGIDQALWDITGKVFNQPVYKLLGGPVRAKVRGYRHASGRSLEELIENALKLKAQGVNALKTGPGPRSIQGGTGYEMIEGPKTIKTVVNRLARLREGVGEDMDIMVDFHAQTSPAVAAILGKELEPLKLLFIEEICPPENIEAMAKAARKTTTPIATGERLITHFGFREIIEKNIADVLQPDINHAGGITALRKIAAMAEGNRITLAPHNCTGPLGTVASIHLDAAIPNFLIQERCGSGTNPNDPTEIMRREILNIDTAEQMEGSYYPLPTLPGLGVELNEKMLGKYPYEGTKIMARVYREDGSVAEW